MWQILKITVLKKYYYFFTKYLFHKILLFTIQLTNKNMNFNINTILCKFDKH